MVYICWIPIIAYLQTLRYILHQARKLEVDEHFCTILEFLEIALT